MEHILTKYAHKTERQRSLFPKRVFKPRCLFYSYEMSKKFLLYHICAKRITYNIQEYILLPLQVPSLHQILDIYARIAKYSADLVL